MTVTNTIVVAVACMTIAGIAHAQGVGKSKMSDYQPDLKLAADSVELETESTIWSDRNWQGHFTAEYDAVAGQPHSPLEDVVNALSQRLTDITENDMQQRPGIDIASRQYQSSEADFVSHTSSVDYSFQSLVQMSIGHSGCATDIAYEFNNMFAGMNNTGSVCGSNKAADASHIFTAGLPPIARYRVFGVGLLSFSHAD
jgi:hypothetical protein